MTSQYTTKHGHLVKIHDKKHIFVKDIFVVFVFEKIKSELSKHESENKTLMKVIFESNCSQVTQSSKLRKLLYPLTLSANTLPLVNFPPNYP